MRMRRLRSGSILRTVSETTLSADDLMLPLFFSESGRGRGTVPGIPVHGMEECREVAERVEAAGIRSVLVFGIPSRKDAAGSRAFDEDGPTQRAVRGLKGSSGLAVFTDLCLCGFTDHGHCGVLKDGDIDNDATLGYYGRIAESHAEAGADFVAPSGMMDRQVSAIRRALDSSGHGRVGIMAYSAKFHSSFYGPFRDIACSSPGQGDRSSHQIQPGNAREAMREMELDAAEGADILMVKPALPYLDVIRGARERFDLPLAAYQVSGEYSMIKAAAERGWVDEGKAMMESLTSIRRAGADIIITYFAEEAARRM